MNNTFSIVICTLNRCESLKKTLEATKKLQGASFEIIVVDGPSTDNTTKVLKEYEQDIKVLKNPLPNISVSRNLALESAEGEIIVSVDDDVIPPPNLLIQLMEIYQNAGDKCAAVGGVVLDKTRNPSVVQFACGKTNLIGEQKVSRDIQAIPHNLPDDQNWFVTLMGANASYKRNALVKIGGFDNFFEYFLEETDVCVRLVQAGYQIHQTDITVDHYPAKSHNREDQKHLTCWYSLAKNTTYFALKHGFLKIPFPILVIRLALLIFRRCFLRILRLKLTHNLPLPILWKYIKESLEGVYIGWNAGFALYETGNILPNYSLPNG
jgi:hypothetical protein